MSACSDEAGESTVATEQRITQDISAVRGRSTMTLPIGERFGQQPSHREPSGSALPAPSVSRSGSAGIDQAPNPGNRPTGREFALGTCTPCHVVSAEQKSPVRFADAPDFRAIANAPGTTTIGLNI
jgi:hypothetical protein